MANRNYNEFVSSLEKGRVVVHLHAAIGASGSPTLQAWNPATRTYATAGTAGFGGVKSITRVSAGDYTVVLQDTFQRLLGVTSMFSLAGGDTVIVGVGVDSTLTAINTAPGATIGIVCLTATGTPGDPDSGSTMDLEFTLQNSSAL